MISLQPIERRSNLTREEFTEQYLRPLKPVIITDLIDNWKAKEKWTLDFFKTNYGNLSVPVYTDKSSDSGKNYLRHEFKISFREYLEAIEKGNSGYRLFAFNIFNAVPELKKDFEVPEHLTSGFIKEFPFLFFGAKGSKVALHYDVDLPNIFLSQFHGVKRFVLFSQEMSTFLYKHPFTQASYVDINQPDYDKFPALKYASGYEAFLQPGETLFMPTGYWHYIEYTDAGFSLNQRAINSFSGRLRGIANLARCFFIDQGMNKLAGKYWRAYKETAAQIKAETALGQLSPQRVF